MLLCFLLLVFPLKGQNVDLQTYWNDVDFNDTTMIASKAMSDKLIEYFFSFTDGDEQRFDSL